MAIKAAKAAPSKAPPSSCPKKGASSITLGLWNVIAERGEDHVVVSLGADANWYRGRRSFGNAIARPGVLGDVGVLHAELEAALRTLVELVPEAERAFLDEADVGGTVRTTRGRVEFIGRHAFGRATEVGSPNVAVSTDLIE